MCEVALKSGGCRRLWVRLKLSVGKGSLALSNNGKVEMRPDLPYIDITILALLPKLKSDFAIASISL